MRKIVALKLTLLLVLFAPLAILGAEQTSIGLANPFYAMDTSFQRPELKPDQQLDLVKELGFPGVAWHEQAPEQVSASLDALEKRGLKMFTIYYGAKVTPDGQLTYSPTLPRVMEILKGHDTIIWLHIGGKGPEFSALNGDSAVVKALRELAGKAAEKNLRIAIYPHVGEWTARFADATKLAKLVNAKNFGVTYNLCHSLAQGDEAQIPALLEDAKPVLITATICGADSGVTGGNWDKLIQPLGQGTYDVGIVLRKLKELGFTGPIGFQGYGIKKDARSILTPTMAAWKKMTKDQ